MVGYKELAFCIVCFFSLVGQSVWSVAATPEDEPRFLHAVYRVGNLNRTIEFYKVCFGMQLLRKVDIPEQQYAYAIVGFGPQQTYFVLKLIYNYGVDNIDIGTGFGHFGILSQGANQTVEVVRANGGVITRELAPSVNGSAVYAFVLDPNGYSFEITQSDPTPDPLYHLMLRVTNMSRAIDFYKRALGMKLVLEYDNPQELYVVMLGYGELFQTTTLELTYDYSTTEYTKGNGYSHVAISTDDVHRSAEMVKSVIGELGGKIIRLPGRVPAKNTKITSFLDPEGWKTVLVENE